MRRRAIGRAMHHMEPLYRLAGVDERAIPVAVAYLKAASLGLVPLLAYVALRCLCEGMGVDVGGHAHLFQRPAA